MGKAIIIQGADWAAKNLGRVTFIKTDELTIMGMTSIDGVAEYVAILGGNKVSAQWQVNDASIVELSATQGETITLTPLASGNIILSALYEGKTASLNINVEVVEEDDGVITEADLTIDDMRYVDAAGNSRSAMYIPVNITDADKWLLNVAVAEGSPIKVGVQYHDKQIFTSTNVSAPSSLDLSKVSYDSYWITAGNAVICNEENDKSTSPVVVNSVNHPSYICLVFTTNDGTGTPHFDTFKQYVSFRFELDKGRQAKLITQESISDAPTFIVNKGQSNTRSIVYVHLESYVRWNMNLSVASNSTIKVGIQYQNYAQVTSSNSNNDVGKISWDSGWITPGDSMTCDESNKKGASVGTAASTLFPSVIGLCCTYNSNGAGTPTIDEILQYVTFELTLEP